MKSWCTVLVIVFIATVSPVHSSSPFPFSHPLSRLSTALSSLHTVISRVSNLRAARGDTIGSQRANFFAEKIEHAESVGLWKLVWSFGWDYAKNYAWRRDFNYRDLYGAASDFEELARALNEVMGAKSDGERVVWVSRNYERILRVSKSALNQLLNVFKRSGPLKEVVQAIRKEVVEGDLARDILDLGKSDLKGVIEILKDLASQLTFDSHDEKNNEL